MCQIIKNRLEKLRSLMEKNDIDAWLISKAENIRYLSGFTGGSDARLLVSSNKNYIITDSRYFEQVSRECPAWELAEEKAAGLKKLQEISSEFKRVGVESHDITYQFYLEIKDSLSAQIIPLANQVEELRLQKDEAELDCLRAAARIGDEVFSAICGFIKPGRSEREVANEIVYLLKAKGCEKESFDTIAVAAQNAALPHGRPGGRLLEPGDMLTMDFGGFYRGYAGDMTRTVAVASAANKLNDYYRKVLEAQQLGVSLVRAGICCRDIDQAVRNCLKKYDLDRYFLHSTGHGLGLEIHEQPRVSPLSETILAENMVITIEPGIYIAGWGGIRIEDSVIVKSGGCELLTHSQKSLMIIK